jgi:hypothetical protein
MGKRTGGIRSERESTNNVYFHKQNAEELVKYLEPHFSTLVSLQKMRGLKTLVLDACCGKKVLGKVFQKKYGCDVIFQDKEEGGQSILEFVPEKLFHIIICNPPWVPVELAEAIYHKLITFLSPGGILFFVINNTFCYQGSDRAKALPFNKFYFLPRYVFKPSGKPLLDCGVMVFHNGGYFSYPATMLRPFIPMSRINGQMIEELM